MTTKCLDRHPIRMAFIAVVLAVFAVVATMVVGNTILARYANEGAPTVTTTSTVDRAAPRILVDPSADRQPFRLSLIALRTRAVRVPRRGLGR